MAASEGGISAARPKALFGTKGFLTRWSRGWKPRSLAGWEACRHNHSDFRTPLSALQRGFTLIECLIYIAVLGIILNLATHSFFKCLEHSRDLQRNADDIVRAMQAGERWREDIRQATGTPKLTQEDGHKTLRVPRGNGEVSYTFTNGKVWRDAGGRPGRQVFLAGVAASEMVADQRERLTAWRWEVELQSRQSATRVRPLFTFLAVAKTETKR